MTTFDAKFDFRFSCAPGATIDTKIKSLGGDGGYIVGPPHILYKKVGHLPDIIVASGGNYKIPTRVLDAVALRALVPDPALRAILVAAWMVGPERWARLFQDLVSSGGLTDDQVDRIEELGAEIGRAAARMAAADRSVVLNDVIDVPIQPAAGRGRNADDGDLWFVNVNGNQVPQHLHARMPRACARWAQKFGQIRPHAPSGRLRGVSRAHQRGGAVCRSAARLATLERRFFGSSGVAGAEGTPSARKVGPGTLMGPQDPESPAVARLRRTAALIARHAQRVQNLHTFKEPQPSALRAWAWAL